MRTSHAAKIYRERAEECFRLAKNAGDTPIRDTFESLGHEMLAAAADFEPAAAAPVTSRR
jgi:hypothetical protein